MELVWGIVAVAVAVLSWGSVSVPIKVKSLQECALDPTVFQFYSSLSIAASALPFFIWGPIVFMPWAFASAALFVPTNICGVMCVRLIGISLAQSVWSSLICIVAFLWGLFGTPLWDDPPCRMASTALAVVGLALLTLGNGMLAWAASLSTASTLESSINNRGYSKIGSSDGGDSVDGGNSKSGDGSASASVLQGRSSTLRKAEYEKMRENLAINITTAGERTPLVDHHTEAAGAAGGTARGWRVYLLGMFLCACVACLGGTMVVPLKLATLHAPSDLSSLAISFSFCLSFGLGLVGMSLAVAVLRGLQLWLLRGERMGLHVRKGLGPALVQGLLWNIGNVAAIIAISSPLGLTVGYPLCQMALLVAGLWGVLWYKEIRGVRAVACFAAGAMIVCGGESVLAIYGGCASD